MSKYQKLESLDQLDSFEKVFVFKHSRTCPTSLRALKEVERFMDEDQEDIPIVLIDVLSERSFSMKVAAHLDLRHESPQLIYLEVGKMMWNDSHFRITSSKISDVLSSSQ